MRFYLTVLLFAVNYCVWGQFSDNFDDGDHLTNPPWEGQDTNFVVNSNFELQLMAPAQTDTSFLAVATSQIDNTNWTFYTRLDFNPSSSNYARVYLVSDNQNLKGSLNGYFVMLGGADDEISLYRQDGLTITKIIDGIDGSLDSDPALARVSVTRDLSGNWTLDRDTTGLFNYVSEGSVLDATYSSQAYFGFFCRYTSTRSDKFFFDDVGDPYVDGTIPQADSVAVIDSTHLMVFFSEPITQSTAENTANYSVDQGIGSPTQVIWDTVVFNQVELQLTSPLHSPSDFQLTVSGIQDFYGNISNGDTLNFSYFFGDYPSPSDLILNEILFNPYTGGSDFIELYNHSDKNFDLSHFYIADWEDSVANYKLLTSETYRFDPGEYVVLTEDSTDVINDYPLYAPNRFIQMDLPTFPNDSGSVFLLYLDSAIVDQMHYEEEMHFELLDDLNGKSLERISFDLPSTNRETWQTAAEPNGWATPGYLNSKTLSQLQTSTVSAEPAIFSPDNDGYQDLLQIEVQTTQTETFLNVHIYDVEGRLMKELEDNTLIGQNTTLIWDGITDNGEKAPIGSYVVLITLTDLSGKREEHKVVCVLASRL